MPESQHQHNLDHGMFGKTTNLGKITNHPLWELGFSFEDSTPRLLRIRIEVGSLLVDVAGSKSIAELSFHMLVK